MERKASQEADCYQLDHIASNLWYALTALNGSVTLLTNCSAIAYDLEGAVS